jgi:mono/diheme cytochrome c family protein
MKLKTIHFSSTILAIVIIFTIVAFESPPGDRWVAPPSADKIINPLKNNASATKSGKKLFNSYCVVCHGPKGRGDGMAGASLTPKPANLTLQEIQSQTDGAIYWKIMNGRTPMPSYKDVIPDKNVWEMINYLRTLKK